MRAEHSVAERFALYAVIVVWVAIMVAILTHPVFVSHDSLSNYAHVWFISDQLWSGHGIPLRMPMIATHDSALTYPYAFIPWTTAALVYPLLGDWTVTLWLVAGFAAMAAAMFWAFPEVRRGWAAAAVLVNPAFVMAPLSGQLPFMWGMAMLFAAIGCWRRGQSRWAVVAAGLAMATHPAVVAPIALGVVACWLPFEPNRRSLLRHTAVACVIALPAVAMVLMSPVLAETSTAFAIEQFIRTVGVRFSVVAVPMGLAALTPRFHRLPVVAFAALLVINPLLVGPDTNFAFGAPLRRPDPDATGFVATPWFEPGAVYRVLGYHDGKVTMYEIIKHGGQLDSELFPESINRRSWDSTSEYGQFLVERRVDHLLIWHSYDTRYRTNEHDLARQLVGPCGDAPVRLEAVHHGDAFDLYTVRSCSPSDAQATGTVSS